MKVCTQAAHFSSIMLSLLIASHVRADLVTVSNSPNGPFGSTTTLWTQTVGVGAGINPATIMMSVYSNNEVAIPFNGKLVLPIGDIYSVIDAQNGNLNLPPAVSPVSFFVNITHGNSSLVLTGTLTSSSFGVFSVTGNPTTVTVGNRQYDVSFQLMPQVQPGNDSADPTHLTYNAYEIDATIPLNEVAGAPEPSSLLLAGLGAAGLIGGASRRRRLARPSPVT